MAKVIRIQKITQNTEKGRPMMKGVSRFPMVKSGKTINRKGMLNERQ